VVSFTPRPLYPQGKSSWYTLDRRPGGTQSRSRRGGEEKNSQPRAETRIPNQPARSPALYHWIGGGVDPRAGLEAVVKRKITNPCRDLNP